MAYVNSIRFSPYRLQMDYRSFNPQEYLRTPAVCTFGDKSYEAFMSGLSQAAIASDRLLRPEHILLGILRTERELMSLVDPRQKLSIEKVPIESTAAKRSIVLSGAEAMDLRISDTAAEVLFTAMDEARNHNAFYVHSYHLLAGLCKTRSSVSALLERQEFSANMIYDRLKESRVKELLKFTLVEKAPFDPYRLSGRVIRGHGASYKLVRFVQIGGMGAIYAALRAPLEANLSGVVLNDVILHSPLHVQPVCIKFLKPDVINQHPLYGKAFQQEIEIVKDLMHANIIRIVDTGKTDEGLLYYAMEWVDGQSLEEVIDKSPLTAAESLLVLDQVCSALDTAHQRKVIHLDVKPGNIMTSKKPTGELHVKVIDFGLAKVASAVGLTTTLTQIGFTLQYCAPEVFSHQASPRSDVFSLGATLYVMLTGVIPFGTSYVFAKQRMAGSLPHLPSITKQRGDLPAKIDQVIAKALQRDPHSRQQSAMDFFSEYKSALGS